MDRKILQILLPLISLVSAIYTPSTILAQDASQCISQSVEETRYSKEKSFVLTNNCPREVQVFWCLENPGSKYKNVACNDDKYYRMNTVLKFQEKKMNPTTLPVDKTLVWGACFGGYDTFVPSGERKFGCKSDVPRATTVIANALCPENSIYSITCPGIIDDRMNIEVACSDGRNILLIVETRYSKRNFAGAVTMRAKGLGERVTPMNVLEMMSEDSSFLTDVENIPDASSHTYKLFNVAAEFCERTPSTGAGRSNETTTNKSKLIKKKRTVQSIRG
jgi:hypothetical protein